MYDVYNGTFGQWLFSYSSADNVFSKLANYGPMQIEFVNERLIDYRENEYESKTNC